MVIKNQNLSTRRVLIVGSYCHDVLIKDDVVLAESLGGASSFISVVLDALSLPADYVSKVGTNFAYYTHVTHHPPITSPPPSKTTLFHAHFSSEPCHTRRQDRILKRIHSSNPIYPSDLPDSDFDFGLAVGVAGEISPETLTKMLDICKVVFVDIQALIREFDPVDGSVRLVGLKQSGFFHLLPRIGFLKASAEEAPYADVEEARKLCCVVVTDGKEGCKVFWKDGVVRVDPFPTFQIDPTGAGDSFMGGFVAGLVHGWTVPDAALLGNFFGSLTVGQVGLPKFDSRLMQRVKDEVEKMQSTSCHARREDGFKFMKSLGHEQFHTALGEAKSIFTYPIQECSWDLPRSPKALEQGIHPRYTGPKKLFPDTVYEEPIKLVERKP